MIIGVPSEIKYNEERVSLIPEAVATLAGDGHEIIVERDAGVGAGFNSIYEEARARIMDCHAEAFH